jgi:predicted nucleotidyltransferase
VKYETAIGYAHLIAARLRAVNGLIPTPRASFEYLRVRRAWVFGSTVRGKDRPNDLDIMLDVAFCGRQLRRMRFRRNESFIHRTLFSTFEDGARWLRRGMRNVSMHTNDEWPCLSRRCRVLIYPRNDYAG